MSTQASYSGLSQVSSKPGRDWDSLEQQNSDIAAWLTVSGTSIDYPVVAQRDSDADGFYLHHDFWRNPSPLGCPYVARGMRADDRALMVYGHHIGYTDYVFSALADAYQQERFDKLKSALLETREGMASFYPVMAMRVDMYYEPVQTLRAEPTLQPVLNALKKDADALAPHADDLINRAERILILVTCSNIRAGMSDRTLIVFVSGLHMES
ncbi:class B sortase [Collinsella sp. zg1085]|uniref:class B sortase n=1 Tax=Collinsella sp. zg1085 TaxID=2844380 RepID=UPI001C0B0F0A|nr:class B sortase [Collinsella sp. zg1085]QWT17269.1 class B sortase [Collinsella sp. zg1085]